MEGRVSPEVVNETTTYLETKFTNTMNQQTEILDNTFNSFSDGTLKSEKVTSNIQGLRNELKEISDMFTDATNEIKVYLNSTEEELRQLLSEVDEKTTRSV